MSSVFSRASFSSSMSCGYLILDGAQVASTISVPSVSGEPPGPLLPSSSFESYFSAFLIIISLISPTMEGVSLFLKWTIREGSKGSLYSYFAKPQKYWRYGFSWIIRAVSSSENPYSNWMISAPKARCSGFATLPLRLANSFAYFSSICSQGMASAFLIQRLSGFISIPTGWPKSEKLICLLLNLYIVHLLVQAFSLKSEVFYTLIIR